MRLGWWCKSGGGGGIEVSAFFSCASRCALRPCTRWVDRTVGVCVLSAPAGFRTSNPRLGFHHGTRNAQDPPKTRGMVCAWAADTPPYLFFFLFFCLLPLFHFLFLPPPFSPPPLPTPPPRPAFRFFPRC